MKYQKEVNYLKYLVNKAVAEIVVISDYPTPEAGVVLELHLIDSSVTSIATTFSWAKYEDQNDVYKEVEKLALAIAGDVLKGLAKKRIDAIKKSK